MPTYKLFVLPGDGIGPEVMAEVEKIAGCLTREGLVKFEVERGLVGGAAYDATESRSARPIWPARKRRTPFSSPRSAAPNGSRCL